MPSMWVYMYVYAEYVILYVCILYFMLFTEYVINLQWFMRDIFKFWCYFTMFRCMRLGCSVELVTHKRRVWRMFYISCNAIFTTLNMVWIVNENVKDNACSDRKMVRCVRQVHSTEVALSPCPHTCNTNERTNTNQHAHACHEHTRVAHTYAVPPSQINGRNRERQQNVFPPVITKDA